MTRNIVYAYPSAPWCNFPGRQFMLTRALAQHARIIYLECGVKTEESRWKPRAEETSEGITIIHDAMTIRTDRIGRRLSRLGSAVDGAWLSSLLREIGVEDYVYWASAANPRFLRGMRLDRLVFDCIDPCLNPKDQPEVDRDEFAIGRAAKTVFCTAETLLERMQKVNEHTYLLPNGCTADDYDPDELRALPRPAGLANRTGPIVGYMGTFDARIDLESIIYAARKMPELTFALVGRVNEDQTSCAVPLRTLPNVVLPGGVSVEEGRAYVAAFDVGLIPFITGAIGDGINPVKMYMYLMAGKPVVSTWVRECRRLAPLVAATQSPDEFVAAIRAALSSDPASSAARTEFARQNTWDVRAAEAVRILSERGLFEPVRSVQVVS